MGIEQSDKDDLYRKKREEKQEQESWDFFESKKLQRETHDLLHKLAADIANEFWIDISQVQELISGSTLTNLDSLKNSVNSETINIVKLKDAINNAKNQIESHSKRKIEKLRQSVDTLSYTPERHTYKVSEKIIPQLLYEKAKNPKTYSDELIGIGVWFIDTSEAVILFTYALAKWILLTPYHIYLVITGRGSYNLKKHI